MHFNDLDLLLWAFGLLEHLLLLLVLLKRHLARELPIFTAFVANNILRTLVLYGTHRFGSPVAYFYTYWGLALLDTLLQIGVVFELASQVLRPLGSWPADLRRRTLWLPVSCILAALMLTWLAAPPTHSLQQLIVIRGAFFSSALMSELFLCISALAVSMGLPWKTPVARIAQGLGVFAILNILFDGLDSLYGVGSGLQTYNLLAHLRIASYTVCVGYWIVMLARKAPQPKELSEAMRRQLYALQLKLAFDVRMLRDRRG